MQPVSGIRGSEAGAALAEGWRSWTGELAAMLPERVRPDPDRARRADIRLSREAIAVEIVAEGEGRLLADPRPIEDLDSEGWTELGALIEQCRARILLTTPDVYVTSVTLPKAARRRLKSAVALQLSQLAPIEPGALRWAMQSIEESQDGIVVRVAMARAERMEALRSLFEANGMEPPSIHAETPEGSIELAAGHDGSRRWGSRAERRAWAIAAMLILSIPLTTTVGAMALTASTRSRIEELQREAAPRLAADSEARRDEALRAALRPLTARPGVSTTIEDLAAKLPLTDHVKSIRQAGNGALEFTVETVNPDAALASLAQSRFLPNLYVSDVLPAGSGRLAATYRTSPR
jgi:hypothetical protein